MELTLPMWAIPVALSFFAVVGGVLWPISSPGGDYDFGGAFEAALHLIVVVFAVLVIWLVFFIIM